MREHRSIWQEMFSFHSHFVSQPVAQTSGEFSNKPAVILAKEPPRKQTQGARWHLLLLPSAARELRNTSKKVMCAPRSACKKPKKIGTFLWIVAKLFFAPLSQIGEPEGWLMGKQACGNSQSDLGARANETSCISRTRPLCAPKAINWRFMQGWLALYILHSSVRVTLAILGTEELNLSLSSLICPRKDRIRDVLLPRLQQLPVVNPATAEIPSSLICSLHWTAARGSNQPSTRCPPASQVQPSRRKLLWQFERGLQPI